MGNQFVFSAPAQEAQEHPAAPETSATDQRARLFCLLQAEDGQVEVEGFLGISWGVQRPIRLKIQDDKQTPAITSPISSYPVSPASPPGDKR